MGPGAPADILPAAKVVCAVVRRLIEEGHCPLDPVLLKALAVIDLAEARARAKARSGRIRVVLSEDGFGADVPHAAEPREPERRS